jgi:ABC-type multidrug transport system fused ATPase/permease subunit
LPVTKDQIEAAAKAANAHDFISQFPHGYNTVIGAKGSKVCFLIDI